MTIDGDSWSTFRMRTTGMTPTLEVVKHTTLGCTVHAPIRGEWIMELGDAPCCGNETVLAVTNEGCAGHAVCIGHIENCEMVRENGTTWLRSSVSAAWARGERS